MTEPEAPTLEEADSNFRIERVHSIAGELPGWTLDGRGRLQKTFYFPAGRIVPTWLTFLSAAAEVVGVQRYSTSVTQQSVHVSIPPAEQRRRPAATLKLLFSLEGVEAT